MSRIKSVNVEEAHDEVRTVYTALSKKLGRVPNIFLNMGNSAAVLNGYVSLSEATDRTSLDPKLREQIALLVGQTNQCHYCLSAHTAISKGLGLNDQHIRQARLGESEDAKTQAILKFTKAVVENRGRVSNQDMASLKSANVSDTEIVEIILVIILNMFTNYFNNVTDPKIDFPIAAELK